jgi:hypothetical protein
MNSQTFYDTAWTRLLAYGLALVVPPMWAFSGWQPSPTLLNELLAIGFWGNCLLLHHSTPPAGARRHAVVVLQVALAVMAVAVVCSWTIGSLPTSLALPPLSLLIIASAVAALGARVAQNAGAEGLQAFAPFAIGMVIVGLLSTGVAIVQVNWPDAPDAVLIARSGLPGRAIGNLRQPNHLASLLIWGVITLVPLVEWRRIPAWFGGIIGALFMWGVVLSGSRTGLYGGVLILVGWGVLDRRLRGSTRLMLVATLLFPLGVVMWQWMTTHLASMPHVVGAAARLSDGDSSHFAIWANAVEMIRQQPWLGVGWGEFNFAWTLTPFPHDTNYAWTLIQFPHRPIAFFDHTHNLPLQLAVELGIPGAALVLGLLCWALVQGFKRAWAATGDAGHGARAAWVMIAMIALHSLDEYPLWYAYFLLPAAWAWGFTLGSGPAPRPSDLPTLSGIPGGRTVDNGKLIRLSSEGVALRWIGVLMVVASALAAWDYYRISTIFSEDSGLPPLAARIAAGQSSPLFAHHADYAEATVDDPPSRALGALERATHSLLDTRLMIAWSTALAESGQPERARYLVARLREFKKPEAEEFFAPCADATITEKPFQCQPEPPGLTWRDFR